MSSRLDMQIEGLKQIIIDDYMENHDCNEHCNHDNDDAGCCCCEICLRTGMENILRDWELLTKENVKARIQELINHSTTFTPIQSVDPRSCWLSGEKG